MPSGAVLIDTGPLYALFDHRDQRHADTVEFFDRANCELLTVTPVVTELAYHLRRSPRVQAGVLRWVVEGAVTVAELTAGDLWRAAQIIAKYADLPADFADASLVAVAERLGVNAIATFDSDFDVYRLHDRDPFVRAL